MKIFWLRDLASRLQLPLRGCRGPAARGAELAESCQPARCRMCSTRGAVRARVHEARSHSRVRQPVDRTRLRYHAELPLGIQHAADLLRPCCCAEALVCFVSNYAVNLNKSVNVKQLCEHMMRHMNKGKNDKA
jgi:hypothetical protein